MHTSRPFSRRLVAARVCVVTWAALIGVLVYAAPNAPAAIPDREAEATEEIYLRIATDVADKLGVKPAMAGLVNQYGLATGQGYLQDIVADYTGLDISGTLRRFYHKPFVQASMRRVVKPGGLIYLHPAWYCTPWAAEGYAVRPYGDFGIRGKLIKAALPLVASPMLDVLERHPTRLLRWAGSKLPPGPTKFHYRRGDQCLNCGSGWRAFWRTEPGLMIRVQKAGRREA